MGKKGYGNTHKGFDKEDKMYHEEAIFERIRNDAKKEQIPDSLHPNQMRERIEGHMELIQKQDNIQKGDTKNEQKKRLRFLKAMTAAASVCLLAGCTVMAAKFLGGLLGNEKKESHLTSLEVSLEQGNGETKDIAKYLHEEGESKGFRTVTYDEVYASLSKVWEEREEEYRYYDMEVMEESVESVEENVMSMNQSQETVMDWAADDTMASGTQTPMPEAGSANGTYGATNIQTVGVDEGDIVKNDGRYLYQIMNKGYEKETIQIVDTLDGLKELSNFGDFENIAELYVWENLLLVIENKYMMSEYKTVDTYEESFVTYDYFFRDNTYHEITIYDISDRSTPKEQKVFTLQGNYQSSRIADGYFYGFSRYYANKGDGKEDYDAYVPMLENEYLKEECIVLPKDGNGTSYLVMVSIDLANPTKFADTLGIISDSDRYYVSSNNIYVTYNTYDPVEEEGWKADQTTILRFSYDKGKMIMEAQGSINGYVNDTFSMDEYEGNLRIVTTVNEYCWKQITDDRTGEVFGMGIEDSRQTNALYVLDDGLSVVGKIEGLAEDEQIYSARFFGDTGYFVTFRQIDPLFAVDLSEPSNPTILSELKVSGFSEYLHFYGEDRLFGFGMEANEETGIQEGLKLSMFDISNPADVQEVTREHLEEYNFSEAIYEHHAILIHPSANIIGFSAEGFSENQYRNEYLVYTYENDSFVERFKLDNNPEEYGYCTIRGTFIGDVFYLLSGNGRVQSFDLYTGERLEVLESKSVE